MFSYLSLIPRLRPGNEAKHICILFCHCGGMFFCTHTVNMLFGFQPAPARNAGADVQQFISEFEGEYGTTHPPFLQCSYSEVGERARWGGREG